MDEVLIGATHDVVVCHGDGVDATPAGLQDVDTLQGADVPNLRNRRWGGVREEHSDHRHHGKGLDTGATTSSFRYSLFHKQQDTHKQREYYLQCGRE